MGRRARPPKRKIQPVKAMSFMPGGWPQRLVRTVALPIMISAPSIATNPTAPNRAVERRTKSATPPRPKQTREDLDASDPSPEKRHGDDHDENGTERVD